MYTIKRGRLVKIVKDLVAEYDLDKVQAAAFIGTAADMDKILLGDWSTSECGCLVGTLYADKFEGRRNIDVLEELGDEVSSLGVAFDARIKAFLNEDGQDYYAGGGETVRVV